MKKFIYILIVFILPLILVANETKTGSLTVLLFDDGKPLVANEIKIDGKQSYMTDKDGAIKIVLASGTHQVELFGKSPTGENLGYFKKPVVIKEGRNTEVLATLTKNGADNIDIDTPVAIQDNNNTDMQVASGEGFLKGIVLSSEGGVPIAGARVFVRGTDVDVRTDEQGNFSAKVPSGKTLSISVVHSAYSAQTVAGITVVKDGTTSKVVKLTPASMELEEFVVLAPKVQGSIADVIQEEKNINAIANIIGSEEFSKKGDGSAAAALKRVTGVTLIGGKYVFVRGLGERYSNIELNSLPLPSPDPSKRVVPLDIFPSSLIGSMKVQKSGTADIPANFGGGYIDLRTKNKNEDDYLLASLKIQGNTYTGDNVITYEGSSGDATGYDNGYRDLPASILKHSKVVVGQKLGIYSSSVFGADNYLQMTQDYAARNFGVYEEALPLGGGFSIEGLKNYEYDLDHKLSIFGNYTYEQEHNYVEEEFYSYRYDEHSVPVQLSSTGHKRITTNKYSHSAILNIDYSFADVFKLKYTKLFTHVGEKRTRETEGEFGSNFFFLNYQYLDWDEKTLNADQLTGEFDYALFDLKNNLTFGLEYASALLNQPNDISFQSKLLEDSNEWRFYDSVQNFLGKRLHSEDDVAAFYLNNKTNYGLFSDEDYIQVGLSYSNKDRVSEYQKFYLDKKTGSGITNYAELPGDAEWILNEYVRYSTDYYTTPFAVKSLFEPADYFDANVEETNLFVNIFAKPMDNLEVMAGARYVSLTQLLEQFVENEYTKIIEKEEEGFDIDDIFPSMSIKYKYNDKNIFDLAISRTFIIPDLREFSSGVYFHPYDVATVKGNPDLVYTDIYSGDLKYSYFFSDQEYIKAGLFYKYLINPIEDTQENTSSLPIYSYDNADYATLYGFELDVRKNLDFFGDDILVPYIGALDDFYVAGNMTLSNSDVVLREEQLDTLTTNHRQLQGLSQVVYNASFGYDDKKRSLSLNYNKMGERIRKVGIINEQGVRYGDTYEIPPHLLDFVWIERFDGNYTLKFKVGNILNSEVTWWQDEKLIRQFKTGQTFSINFTYKY